MMVDFKIMFVNGSTLEFSANDWNDEEGMLNLYTYTEDGNEILDDLYIPASNILWWKKRARKDSE